MIASSLFPKPSKISLLLESKLDTLLEKVVIALKIFSHFAFISIDDGNRLNKILIPDQSGAIVVKILLISNVIFVDNSSPNLKSEISLYLKGLKI